MSTQLWKHKRGTNVGYESLTQKKERERLEMQKKGRVTEEEERRLAGRSTQFKGFIAGEQFKTKLGFQGNAFPTLWSKHVFLSFDKDDVELLEIALKSELSDITEVVEGGQFTSAFSIGDLGFYAKNQFDAQGDLIRNYEKKITKGSYFLSAQEWATVNKNIDDLVSFANIRSAVAIRGDSFGALALRANAYNVAKRMIEVGLDPMIANENGDDLFSIIEEQYHHMCGVMHELLDEKELSKSKILMPSEQNELERRESEYINVFEHMEIFLTQLVENLKDRNVRIKEDKAAKRRLELRRASIDPEMIKNIALEGRTESHLEQSRQLHYLLNERIETYIKQKADFVNLASLMHKQHAVISKLGANSQKKKMWSYKDEHEKKQLTIEAGQTEQNEESKVSDNLSLSAFAEAERKGKELVKQRTQAKHGLETDAERMARETQQKEEEETKALMAISLEKDRDEAEEKRKKEQLQKETYSPIQGVLRSSQFEQVAYR